MKLLQFFLKKILLILLIFQSGVTMALTLNSSAFSHMDFIPAHYTCDSSNKSPELSWTDVPENTQSFVLIMDDPDAPGGTWDHWILFNIPQDSRTLAENLSTFPKETKNGSNSWQNNYYQGPCPPPEQAHRYYFKLYALDNTLALKEGATKKEIEAAMKTHILGTAELVGKYQRKK
jgi:Raf kinase inhibitor-like YbhB/YbcL family protein